MLGGASSGSGQEWTRAAVLRTISLEGPVSRTAVGRKLGVSPATVTAITRELLELGLIRHVGKEPSGGGRPAELLELVADSAHVIGVKVATDRVIGVVEDLAANVLGTFTEPIDGTPDQLLDELVQVLRQHMVDGPGVLLGVGLGVPGMVDSSAGGRVDAPTIGLVGVELGSELQRQLGVPVIVENDVHTLAVAERLYGMGQDVEDFITVTIGRGVGLGIVIGGELHAGQSGGAGEVGHLLVDPEGPLCDCGRRGCLEAVISEPAMVRRAIQSGLIPNSGVITELREAAEADNEDALEIFDSSGRLLGRVIASVVNLLAPQRVLISGEGTGSWPFMAGGFDLEFRSALLDIHRDISVVVDSWDDLDWARGAVSLLTRSIYVPATNDGTVERQVRSRLAGAKVMPGDR